MATLVCSICRRTFGAGEVRWRCDCGGLLDLHAESQCEPRAVVADCHSMWRYRATLPIDDDRNIISFDEGFTPLTPVTLDGREVLFKQDHLFPSGSYKDRGAALLVSRARELGVRAVVEDSSGNAGAAIATYCARADIACTVYVPEHTSSAKLAQIEAAGAELVRVPGTRDDTAQAVMAAAERAYYASHTWNPYFFHGTKTFAYEICEQLGWRAPDVLVLPVGNGTLLLGAQLGFSELCEIGAIERKPRLIGVQAASCAPLHTAFVNGADEPAFITTVPTSAEGIAVGRPVRGRQILSAVRASGGDFVVVSEAEISGALGWLLKHGWCVEPTVAATLAGARKVLPGVAHDATVVVPLTGHGLKTPNKLRIG